MSTENSRTEENELLHVLPENQERAIIETSASSDVQPSVSEVTETKLPEPEATKNEAMETETTENEATKIEVTETVTTETETVEEDPIAAASEEEPHPSGETAASHPALAATWQTKEEVLTRLKELEKDAENAGKQELDALKQAFYKLHKAEQENARKQFIETHGEEAVYTPVHSTEEAEFKSIMSAIREKRNALNLKQEKLKEENLQKKTEIIEKIKTMVESSEDVNKAYNEFKKLQQEWNEIRLVPQGKINDLWKSYQFYVEQFYDLIKMNNEFREYDFKKNLEIKTNLCIAAEKLTQEPDVVSAFHQLQKLHQSFRETGPVAKELREDLWNRFKAASTEINRRHQAYFEELKAAEQTNLDQKTVICEIVESIEYDSLKTFAEWDHKTKEVIALQAKWKTIGYAPQKMNQKIFERFRSACDEFFRRKGEFFKKLKEQMSANLEKKKALCEQAEALKDSTDWKETTEILTKLQKEWKEIGPVQKKYSDAVWKQFIAACDSFFDRKNKATSSQRGIEAENLEKKKAILTRLEELDESLEGDEAVARIKGIIKEYNEIGHVPFKEKDKIYKRFRELVDKEFDRLHVNAVNRKLSNFRNAISQGGKESQIGRERRDLMRTYENLKNEIQTYENNLGFLNASSKKGNSLVTELNRKVEKLRADLGLIIEKIKMLDEADKKQEEN